MYILGISAYYHDSAAALIKDGEVIAAAQEERFTRKKHDKSFPINAVSYCLSEAAISISEIQKVVFYEDTRLKFFRILDTHATFFPHGLTNLFLAINTWIFGRLHYQRIIKRVLGFNGKIDFISHHQAHAAAAFYPSPFEEAAILTIDGVGEFSTLSIGIGEGSRIKILKEMRFPDSVGLLYSAFTYFCGFKVNSGEYKLMGLAPYGTPKYVNLIKNNIVTIHNDGSIELNMKYFDFAVGDRMTNENFSKLFGFQRREPESDIREVDMDLAASIQKVTEEIVLKVAQYAKEITGKDFLCMAGGVALNCVANGHLFRSGIFNDIWVQPASGDAGSSLGAALAFWFQEDENQRYVSDEYGLQGDSCFGPKFEDFEIEKFLQGKKAKFKKFTSQEMLAAKLSNILAEGNVVGLFRGRMEFGPRALGNRSILGDARDPEMQTKMNLKIKFRESFRPFAPLVLEEKVSEYFDVFGKNKRCQKFKSPYMLNVSPVKTHLREPLEDEQPPKLEDVSKKRSVIPAVTHLDYSARIQTVSKKLNPFLHRVLYEFEKLSGVPILVNTSFNVRNEPIVLSPEDAYRCFMRTNMDYLAIGSFLLKKEEQPKYFEKQNWKELYELD